MRRKHSSSWHYASHRLQATPVHEHFILSCKNDTACGTYLLSPRAISSPGVVTRHRLALCRAQKVSADAVIARLIDRRVTVIQPKRLKTTYE